MRDSANDVAAAGWPAFWYKAQRPAGRFRAPHHGNRRHGTYSKSGRAAMREVRLIGALLSGRFHPALLSLILPTCAGFHSFALLHSGQNNLPSNAENLAGAPKSRNKRGASATHVNVSP